LLPLTLPAIGHVHAPLAPQVSIVAEQLLRLLHHCGMPRTDADLIHGSGRVVNELLMRAQPRSTLFTGSQRVAEKLALDLKGKVRGNSARMGLEGGFFGACIAAAQHVGPR
jgi:delta 1-pyrroline-5-carboxylate dehydrogenase